MRVKKSYNVVIFLNIACQQEMNISGWLCGQRTSVGGCAVRQTWHFSRNLWADVSQKQERNVCANTRLNDSDWPEVTRREEKCSNYRKVRSM